MPGTGTIKEGSVAHDDALEEPAASATMVRPCVL